jgi:hypothetical protein
VTATVYLSEVALAQIDAAQAEMERHLVSDMGGRCAACGALEPCAGREALQRVFMRYGHLPRRRPGLTRAGVR